MSEIKLLHGDCLEMMKEIPDGSVDLILTDPPYKVISGGKSEGFKNSIFKENDGKIFKENNLNINDWIKEIYRILKKDTHVYIFTNFMNLTNYLNVIGQYFYIHNLLVWEKNNCLPNRWYMKNCEYIIFAKKGNAKSINIPSSKTVLHYNNVKEREHPTQKPVQLLETLILNSTNKGETVLDFTMGSGSTGVACKNLNRNFIGIELDDKYFEIAKQRIENGFYQEKISEDELNSMPLFQ